MEEISIGEFARRPRVSLEALSLYDELGVLVPSRIDRALGYRYHESAKLEETRLCRRSLSERRFECRWLHRATQDRVPCLVDPFDERTWSNEGLRIRRKRAPSPNQWRWQWPNPRSLQSECW